MTSTIIRLYMYNTATSTLTVEFVSGNTYEYYNVPATVYNLLVKAQSKGQFFNANIRGNYRFARLDNLPTNVIPIARGKRGRRTELSVNQSLLSEDQKKRNDAIMAKYRLRKDTK